MVFLVFSLSFCRCGGGSFGQRIIPCKPVFKNKTNSDQKRKRHLHFGFVRRVWNSFLVNCLCFHISFLTELAVVLLIWWFFVRFFANWELAPKKVCLCKMESIIEGMSLFFFFQWNCTMTCLHWDIWTLPILLGISVTLNVWVQVILVTLRFHIYL